MTRKSLNATLRRVYVWIGLILAGAFVSRMAGHIPGLAGSSAEPVFADVYNYLKDMVLLIVTVVAAYLANVFQQRATFVDSLRQEWRTIVRTKSQLVTFCDKAYPTAEEYLSAYSMISECIDNMRVVYRNVGETAELIGLYPYAPLHDMRRALMMLDPRQNAKVTAEQRLLVRDAVLQAFSALRERFLDELDLEEPTRPLIASVSRRLKVSGATKRARFQQETQTRAYEAAPGPRPDVDALLSDLYYREMAAEHAEGRRAPPSEPVVAESRQKRGSRPQ